MRKVTLFASIVASTEATASVCSLSSGFDSLLSTAQGNVGSVVHSVGGPAVLYHLLHDSDDLGYVEDVLQYVKMCGVPEALGEDVRRVLFLPQLS